MRQPNHPMEPDEIMGYLDGELSVDRAASAAAHLERCPECQTVAGDLRTVAHEMLSWQVEETRLQMNPALSVALAERASRRPWRVRPWVWALVGATAVLLVLAIPRRQPPSVSDDVRASPPPREMRSEAKPEEQIFGPPQGAAQSAGYVLDAPLVARTASLNLTTSDFEHVRGAIDDFLTRHKGYLASLNITAPAGAARSLTANLRVPAADLPAAMSELKHLGRVDSEQQSGEEVTEQYADLEARLANARNTEQRLTEILRQRTGKLSDVLDVETEIDRVRGQIEKMDGEKKGLTKRIEFSTIDLTVTEAYKARLDVVPDSTFGRLRNAAVEGYANMIGGIVAVGLFSMTVGPTVLLWTALLFFPLRYAWRRWRRRGM